MSSHSLPKETFDQNSSKTRDFTLAMLQRLFDSLEAAGYKFQTFAEFLTAPQPKAVILRHDIDARKTHALTFARLQKERGIKGSYYFRIVPESFDAGIIREIFEMGHEIGYHYEDMDIAQGDHRKAIQLFARHLEKIREIAPVSTICMHGSPRSSHDNRDLWKHYDYRDFGIAGEPYFDLDFSSLFYLTDTGRRWDGHKVSIRDKVENNFGLSFHETQEVVDCLLKGAFPPCAMFTFHPQRWTDSPLLWLKEKYFQELKNVVKSAIVQRANSQ